MKALLSLECRSTGTATDTAASAHMQAHRCRVFSWKLQLVSKYIYRPLPGVTKYSLAGLPAD